MPKAKRGRRKKRKVLAFGISATVRALKKKTYAELPQVQADDLLMRAVLSAASLGPGTLPQVSKLTAELLGFVSAPLATKQTGDSFKEKVATCIEVHVAARYIARIQDKFVLLGDGRQRLLDPKPFVSSEPAKGFLQSETPTQVQATPAPRVDRILQAIPEMPPERLLALWSNAVKILADPSRRARHGAAMEAIKAVEKAWEALERVEDDEFVWPSTEIGRQTRLTSLPDIRGDGLLSYLGYRAGKVAGLPAPERQSILARVFEGRLPPVFDPEYMEQWGRPGSALRLGKMAESLAAFARNAKRNDEDRLDEAIRHWEQDLEFLHDRYYVGRFGFGWPSTSINGIAALPRQARGV